MYRLTEIDFARLSQYSDVNVLVAKEKGLFKSLLCKLKISCHLHSLWQTRQVWDSLVSQDKIKWTPRKALTIGIVQDIQRAFSDAITYSGRGASPDLAEESPSFAKQAMDYLLCRRARLPEGKILTVLIRKRDPHLFGALFEEWKRAMEESCTTGSDPFVIQAFIGNLLTLLPYTSPPVGASLKIPIYREGAWTLISYTIEQKFYLTPEWYSEPLPAYGLVSAEAPSILTFQGSTFPAGEGFMAALLADFTLGCSVGYLPARWGHGKVKEWLTRQEDVQGYGVSLGGAIALRIAHLYKGHFSAVHAFNAPGTLPHQSLHFDNLPVYFYSQWNDLVSSTGLLPTGESVRAFRVLREKQDHFAKCHNVSYSGSEQVTYMLTTPKFENGRITRIALTILHGLGALILFPFFLLHLLYRLVRWAVLSLVKAIGEEETITPQQEA